MSFFKVYIPARYASVRLPGKPLLDIGGRPLIRHVYERARAAGAGAVVIATDDARIREAAVAFGAAVLMTSVAHRSGTERIAEACALNGEPDDLIVVNLQADEPEMPAPLIREVAQLLADTPEAEMATLCAKIERSEELFDPNVVKVVVDERGDALYFSRAPIPWARDLFAPATPTGSLPDGASWLRHIGLYAYRVGFLRRFSRLPPSPLEAIEQLEQLRALHHGARIRVRMASVLPPIGIDTPDDLERARMAQLTSPPG